MPSQANNKNVIMTKNFVNKQNEQINKPVTKYIFISILPNSIAKYARYSIRNVHAHMYHEINIFSPLSVWLYSCGSADNIKKKKWEPKPILVLTSFLLTFTRSEIFYSFNVYLVGNCVFIFSAQTYTIVLL